MGKAGQAKINLEFKTNILPQILRKQE